MTIETFSDEYNNIYGSHRNVKFTLFEWDNQQEKIQKTIDFIDRLSEDQLSEICEILPDFQDQCLNIFYFGVPENEFSGDFLGFEVEEFYSFQPAARKSENVYIFSKSGLNSLWSSGSINKIPSIWKTDKPFFSNPWDSGKGPKLNYWKSNKPKNENPWKK